MFNGKGILLTSHFINKMTVGGETAWFIKEFSASSGYMWRYRPDNSGTYELIGNIVLHPSADATGVPGNIIWQFNAIRKGSGEVMFELFPPGSEKAVETILINIAVE